MGDWLGFINKWNKRALLSLLQDLRTHLSYLEEQNSMSSYNKVNIYLRFVSPLETSL